MEVKVGEMLKRRTVADYAVVFVPGSGYMHSCQGQAVGEVRCVPSLQVHDVENVALGEIRDVILCLWRPVRNANALG